MHRRSLLLLPVLILVFLLSFATVGWRLDQAPDVLSDEVVYTRVGIRVAAEGAQVWDSGRPAYVHPPLYFLLESLYLRVTSTPESALHPPDDIFEWVYQARNLNAILAGLTGLVLYWLGYRLHGHRLGLLLFGLFVLDPFGVRINRRAMLETLAGLLMLSGMSLLVIGLRPGQRTRAGWTISRAIAAGLLLGSAMLSKELTFNSAVAVLVFAVWHARRLQNESPSETGPFLRSAATTLLVAAGTYLIFPLWVYTSGQWERFLEIKLLSLQRLLGLVQLTGWNRSGFSLLDFLGQRLLDYGSSYLLLGMGALAVLFLWFTLRTPITRFLIAWGAVLYPFFLFTALAGAGNDQFFYFLLLPALLFAGYAIVLMPDILAQRGFLDRAPRSPLATRLEVWLGLFVVLLFAYNLLRWSISYGWGVDNGYQQLAAYVAQNLPPDAPLNASGDVLKSTYFFPERSVYDWGTPLEAEDSGLRYFVLVPKDVRYGYGNVTPELALWLRSHGELVFATAGSTYGDILLYEVVEADSSGSVQSTVPLVQREFAAAESGNLRGFVTMLSVWMVVWAGLGLTLGLKQFRWRTPVLEWETGHEGH